MRVGIGPAGQERSEVRGTVEDTVRRQAANNRLERKEVPGRPRRRLDGENETNPCVRVSE